MIDTAGSSTQVNILHAASASHSTCVASAGQHESGNTAIPATSRLAAAHPEVAAAAAEGRLN